MLLIVLASERQDTYAQLAFGLATMMLPYASAECNYASSVTIQVPVYTTITISDSNNQINATFATSSTAITGIADAITGIVHASAPSGFQTRLVVIGALPGDTIDFVPTSSSCTEEVVSTTMIVDVDNQVKPFA